MHDEGPQDTLLGALRLNPGVLLTILTTGAYDLPAVADRNRTSMMLAAGTGTLGVIDGVHSGLNLTKTTGMGFSIGPGRAAVNGTSAAEGTFTVAVTASEIGAFAPGDATKDRIDVIVLKTYPGNPSGTGAKVEVIQGALPASGEPVVPTVPAGSLALFRVRIGAGVSAGNGGWLTSKITDVRRAIGVPEYIDFTPTFGGFASLGTGAVREGRYRIDGDSVSVNVHLKLGTGASWTNRQALYFTLPVPAEGPWIYYGQGAHHYPDSSGYAHGFQLIATGTVAAIWSYGNAGGLDHPDMLGIPLSGGNEIFCNLDYRIALP